MSYANMKPMDSKAHEHIAAWVRGGGKLLFCGTDADPYQRVQEWWNRGGNAYAAPSQHLFGLLGMPLDAPAGEYACGEGFVTVIRRDPKDFVLTAGGDAEYLAAVRGLYGKGKQAGTLEFKNHFYLERDLTRSWPSSMKMRIRSLSCWKGNSSTCSIRRFRC